MFTLAIFATLVLTTASLDIVDDYLTVLDENDNVRNQYLDFWDLTKDVDIWDESTKNSPSRPVMTKATAKHLCTNYHVVIDDQIIDCKDLKLIQKTMKSEDSHQLSKRQAEPEVTLDEGSGNGEYHSFVEEHIAVEEHPAVKEQQAVEQHPAAKEQQAVEGHQTVEEHQNVKEHQSEHPTLVVDPAVKEHPAASEAEKVAPVTPSASDSEHVAKDDNEHLFHYQSGNVVDLHAGDAENGDTSKNVQKNSEIKLSEQHQTQNSSDGLGVEQPVEGILEEIKPTEKVVETKLVSEKPALEIQASETPTNVKSSEQTPPKEKPVELEPVSESTTVTNPSISNLPVSEHGTSSLKEVKPAEPIASQKPIVQEKPTDGPKPLKEENTEPVPQTPVAKEMPKEDTNTGVKKGRKATNVEKEPENDIATASVGEAKEPVSQKDTKILIGLFGAVIGCGVAAFGYNHIRKRQRANASRTATNGINMNDPEEGREMKPLMKNNSGKQTVEYQDERPDKTEEVSK